MILYEIGKLTSKALSTAVPKSPMLSLIFYSLVIMPLVPAHLIVYESEPLFLKLKIIISRNSIILYILTIQGL